MENHSSPQEGSSFVSPEANRIVEEYLGTLRSMAYSDTLTDEERRGQVADAFEKLIEAKTKSGCTDEHLYFALWSYSNEDGSFDFEPR